MPRGESSRASDLRQPAQRELAHRERRGLRVALHAGGRAGEEDRARALRQHPPRGLLRHQKAAEGRDRDRFLDLGRLELDQRPAGAEARVVDDHIGRAEARLDPCEKPLDASRLVASQAKTFAPVSAARPDSFSVAARRQRDLHSVLAEQPGKRGGEPAAGPDDERGAILRHLALLRQVQPDVQLAQLLRRDLGRRAHQQVLARWFIGNMMTSRRFSSPPSSMTMRSMPGAMPPCGGAP